MGTYDESLQYWVDSFKRGKKHDFAALRRVLAVLGNPHESIAPRVIHVAGTNGKGSVCAMLSAILAASGRKVGMFTSPHLHRFNERIAINGAPIDDEALAAQFTAVAEAERTALPEGDYLSYFELLTMAAFRFFAAQNVDYAIIEAGIGGRLDATNVIETNALAVITSVGLDHTDILGGTIDEIAREKSGIIKKNSPVVLYSAGNQVYNRIKLFAETQNAPLLFDEGAQITATRDEPAGITFDVQGAYFGYCDVTIGLSGAFQPMNACTALLCINALNGCGAGITEAELRNGLAQARWPGRMEILGHNPLVVVDGAHNRDAAEMFKKSAAQYFAGKHVTMIIGVLRDKEYDVLVNEMTEQAAVVILTKPAYAARATEPRVLYDTLIHKNKLVITESDYRRAFELALRLTPGNGVICCAGSLYLVGDIRQVVLERSKEGMKCLTSKKS